MTGGRLAHSALKEKPTRRCSCIDPTRSLRRCSSSDSLLAGRATNRGIHALSAPCSLLFLPAVYLSGYFQKISYKGSSKGASNSSTRLIHHLDHIFLCLSFLDSSLPAAVRTHFFVGCELCSQRLHSSQSTAWASRRGRRAVLKSY